MVGLQELRVRYLTENRKYEVGDLLEVMCPALSVVHTSLVKHYVTPASARALRLLIEPLRMVSAITWKKARVVQMQAVATI